MISRLRVLDGTLRFKAESPNYLREVLTRTDPKHQREGNGVKEELFPKEEDSCLLISSQYIFLFVNDSDSTN